MGMHVRVMREEERERVKALHGQAFNAPPWARARLDRSPTDAHRVLERDGDVVACLAVRPIGHIFGGRSVPCAGIAGVAVAPEARGARVAETLITETLREVRSSYAISTLYPSTLPLYRRCGYGQGATRTRYRIGLRALPRGKTIGCEPWTDASLDEVAEAYREFATQQWAGLIDRPRTWWIDRLLATFDPEQEVFRYLVREHGRVTGSVIFTQEHRSEGHHFDMACRDFFWTTPEAGRALLALAARNAMQGEDLLWLGSPADPLALLIEEEDILTDDRYVMMARILDLPAAIASRGYPAGIAGAFDIEIADDVLPENSGVWRIEVGGGVAKAMPGGRPQARTSIGGFTSLWSGFLSVTDAIRAGVLDADASTADALRAAFTGPAPWVIDYF